MPYVKDDIYSRKDVISEVSSFESSFQVFFNKNTKIIILRNLIYTWMSASHISLAGIMWLIVVFKRLSIGSALDL